MTMHTAKGGMDFADYYLTFVDVIAKVTTNVLLLAHGMSWVKDALIRKRINCLRFNFEDF